MQACKSALPIDESAVLAALMVVRPNYNSVPGLPIHSHNALWVRRHDHVNAMAAH